MFTILAIYSGLISAAISGVVEAKRQDMDVVGACTVAFITALGGGTLRDLLLGRHPVFWVEDQMYAIITFITALIVFYSEGLLDSLWKNINFFDAIGLAMFSLIGVQVAQSMQTPFFATILMGIVTGVFGGILRDVLCNQIPNVFARSAQLYATCSFVGSCAYLALDALHIQTTVASLLSFGIIFGMRMMALRFNLRLPDP